MIRTTQLTIGHENGQIFDEGTYTVTIDDEGGGEFVVIEEVQDTGTGKIRVDATTWPELVRAVGQLLSEARP